MSTAVKDVAPLRLTGAPVLPQVNLLPPEVRAGRALSRVRAWLGIALLALALAIGLVFLWATWSATQADQELASIQDQNHALQARQSEYAEVPQVLGQIKDLTTARSFAMAPEILWQPLTAAISAVTPTGLSIDNLTVTQTTPWSTSALTASAPLATAGTIADVSLTARSATVPDTAAWEDGLAALPGVVDVSVSNVSLADDKGTPYYATSATLRITVDAYAARFAEKGN